MAKVIELKNGQVDMGLVRSWLKEQLYVVEPSRPVPWEDVEYALVDQFENITDEQVREIKEWIKGHKGLSKRVVFGEEEEEQAQVQGPAEEPKETKQADPVQNNGVKAQETKEKAQKKGNKKKKKGEKKAQNEPTKEPTNNITFPREEYKKQMAYMYQFHQRLLHNNPELDAVATDSKYWRMVESEFGIDRSNAPTWVRALMTALWKRDPQNWKEELVKKLEEYGFKVNLSARRKKREEIDIDRERQRYLNILKRSKEALERRLKEIEEEKKAINQRLKEIEEEIAKFRG